MFSILNSRTGFNRNDINRDYRKALALMLSQGKIQAAREAVARMLHYQR